MEARAVCEILKYIIIHWKREAAEVSQEALLEGELLISIEESSSKHRADPFHYVTTKIQSLLSGFSGKLTWPSEEARCSQDLSGLASFHMRFEVDEKPTPLMTDCLVIKQFLHKTSIVHPKVRFHFCVKVNGVLSKETFGVEKEPMVKLRNGIGLLTSQHHYMRPGSPGAQRVCSRIHPVLGQPVVLFIPDEGADMGLWGELTLTPAAALCHCCKLHASQTTRISKAFVFLYGPSGLPLVFPNQEHPLSVFSDDSYLFDWKKHHLCAAPSSNVGLQEDLVLPDVSYWIESHGRSQPPDLEDLADTEKQALLLFLLVDFHSGFPADLTEAWGMQSLLLTHLNNILLENRSLVQGAVQMAVDEALGQHHRVVKAQQKLQVSVPVAVNSILSIVAGSTSNSFRARCLQTLQAADTQELRMRLLEGFHRTLHQRFLHSTCDPHTLPPEPTSSQDREDGDQSLEEPVPGSCCPGAAPRPKRRCPGAGEVRPARDAPGMPPLSRSGASQRPQAKGWASSETRGEDTLWLQEVSNLSEWLSAGPAGPDPREAASGPGFFQ
ncbi:type 2 DNA topoisomerase 6 subunit B-like [Dromiciops gliroides]|uniref:type 2 DNA topoisomerase 6 subunit B-like n=1 Tax=Dromiciops gliroides TaxID=33562 RepID=UPI001CC371D9|nr:type 2 DNA topoisomerase 6 subunit B-like [Dromiciops gliroides]